MPAALDTLWAVNAERQPDKVTRITVHGGHKVAAYSYGAGQEALLCLHGGPGLSSDYLRDSHSRLAAGRFSVVSYDQLGCGASDRPDDPSLWSLSRYVEEVEMVREALGLGRVHLLGQSWGAMLAIEYALAYPDAIKTLILADGAASVPHLVGEQQRLRAALGPETVAMMQRHEAEGTFEHPEYTAAIDILTFRHVCRLRVWPDSLLRSVSGVNNAVYHALQGPNEFLFTGALKDWDRLGDLHRIDRPALVLCGQYDHVTPACSELMHDALPDSRLAIFPQSSHLPFLEEPEAYFEVLQFFLDQHAD